MRRPVAATVTRRPHRWPHPSATPSHTGVDASRAMSGTSCPGSPTAMSTDSRACTRASTRRSIAAFSRRGMRVTTSSKPSSTAATRSAHAALNEPVSAPGSMRTSRSSGTPSSATASTPSHGTSTTASQAPAAVASAARAMASDVAAGPPQATVRPRASAPSGSSGWRGSATGRVRWRARVVGATAAARSIPAVYEQMF